MSIIEVVFLGIVQGLTEFIPISSSGHLVLIPYILGIPNPSILIDVFLHFGTLIAVCYYFSEDLVEIIHRVRVSLRDLLLFGWKGKGEDFFEGDSYRRLFWLLLVGSLPTAIMGLSLKGFFEGLFESPNAVIAMLGITGIFLLVGSKIGKGERGLERLTIKDTLLIGLSQGLAIAPGLSRSGLTITTGLLRGLKPEAAAKFSFLLSIPAILGATVVKARELLAGSNTKEGILNIAIGTVVAFIAGYLAIGVLLRFLRQGRLILFAYYCWLMAGVVLFFKFFT